MDKEFVTYEHAVALKELGFDKPCFGYFNNTKIKGWLFDFDPTLDVETLIFAPTYSQAFKWFRENGIDYSIVPMRVDGWNEYQYVIFTLDEIVETSFNSYEEAEQACLDKLIKIIKKLK